MSTHTSIDRICLAILAITLVVTLLFMNGEALGIQAAANSLGYEDRLFDTSTVHTLNIIMEDWEGFLESCTNEEYVECSVVIDNEAYKNVAIRAKGNTSLTQVEQYGNDRYSFKIEFDHYDSSKTYHGLDKLCLNNIIQDNTYMKDYLTYRMMNAFGVNAPLCSYVQILVNGEEWGLYLAVEGVEDSFLERNYGSDYGELYKPDSQSMGGGRGNGQEFSLGQWEETQEDPGQEAPGTVQEGTPPQPPEGFEPGQSSPADQENGEDSSPARPDRGQGGMGGSSEDVSLIYTDDSYDSYSNIFDNAKTDITDADKDRLIQSLKELNQGENLEQVLDLDQVVRYFVVHNFVCNFDSYTGSMIHNYYLYEEDGKLSMIPWDYNLAFGAFMGGSDATTMVNYPIDTPVSGGTVDSRPMLSWIFQAPEYTQLYHEYFSQFIQEQFDSGAFSQMVEETVALISPYVESDPTKFCTYEEYQAGVEALEEFCLLRAQSISGQLAGTIPSTQEGQQEDPSALVDASSLSLSLMGSMNMGGGMGGPQGGDRPGFDPSSSSLPQNPAEGFDPPASSVQDSDSLAGATPASPSGEAPQPPEGETPEAPGLGNVS